MNMSMTSQPLHKVKPKPRKGTRVKNRVQIAAAHERRGAKVSDIVRHWHFLGAYQGNSHYVDILPVNQDGSIHGSFHPVCITQLLVTLVQVQSTAHEPVAPKRRRGAPQVKKKWQGKKGSSKRKAPVANEYGDTPRRKRARAHQSRASDR